jgi:ankyrin repeat protein
MGRGAHGHSHDSTVGDAEGGHGHSHGGGGADDGHGHSHGQAAPQYGTELEVVTASVKSLLTGLRERNALPADGDESTHREVDEEQRKHMQEWTSDTWAPVTAQLTEMQLQQMRGKLCERPSSGGGATGAAAAADSLSPAASSSSSSPSSTSPSSAAPVRPPPTDVFEAAQYGSEAELARMLAEDKRLAQAMDIHGLKAVHYAARRPHAALVQQLLESGADPNAAAENERGDTVLMMAAASGDVEVVHRVMEAGADVNTGGEGVTGYPLHSAVQKNRLLPLLMLLQAGADPDLVDSKQQTPMHWAAYQGMVTPMRYLLNHGACPSLSDDRGLTPLHWAAALGHLPVVEYLLEQLPEEAAAVSNAGGFSPLSMAEHNEQEEVVAVLRKHLAKLGLLQAKGGEGGEGVSGGTSPPLLSDRVFARVCAVKKDPRFPYVLPFVALPMLWCSIGLLSGYLKPVGILWSLEILFATIGGSRNLSFFKRAGPLFVGIFSNSYFHSVLVFLYVMVDGGLPPEENWNVILFLCLNLCLATLYLQLITSEPGVVEPKEDEMLELMKAIREGKSASRFCHTCMMRLGLLTVQCVQCVESV